ncbi:MAG: Gfo/Idh/MocA family oxidoreductase [Actinomycetota bacterium]|nr:Gfo/Idh/MocA family oxidoreductase [Actinomycetota bacterium]
MNKVRLGVIGPGLVWERVHEQELKRFTDKFEIAAFCARSDKSKKKVEKEYPGIPFYRDYKVMLKEPFIDAVIIMTPIPMNPVIAGEALDAGKDVFVEKPLATNSADAGKLIKKEKNSGRKIFVLEQFVHRKFTDRMIEIINSGKIGDILMFERVYHGYIGTKKEDEMNYGNTEWRMKPEYPLGMLMDGGIHEIAALSKIFGKPRSVFATGVKYRQDSYGDYDYESMIFEYKNNLIGTFCNSYYLNGKKNCLIIRGTKGLAYYEEGLTVTVEENNGGRDIINLKGESPYDLMWGNFVDCLDKGIRPYYTSDKALDDLEIFEAIGKSLKEGVRVTVAG